MTAAAEKHSPISIEELAKKLEAERDAIMGRILSDHADTTATVDNHYSTGRRWSELHQGWIFREDWTPADEISKLRAAITMMDAWVIHWQADVAGGLTPTVESLDKARGIAAVALSQPSSPAA